MIFHVTKNDIKLASNSVRWSQTECVIGRTIGRKIPTARVGVGEAWCTDKCDTTRVVLPKRVVAFIRRYVHEGKPRPFSFTLTPKQVALLRGKV